MVHSIQDTVRPDSTSKLSIFPAPELKYSNGFNWDILDNMNINNIENILEFPQILPMVNRDFICITALILIVLLLLMLHSVQEDSQAFGPWAFMENLPVSPFHQLPWLSCLNHAFLQTFSILLSEIKVTEAIQ